MEIFNTVTWYREFLFSKCGSDFKGFGSINQHTLLDGSHQLTEEETSNDEDTPVIRRRKTKLQMMQERTEEPI